MTTQHKDTVYGAFPEHLAAPVIAEEEQILSELEATGLAYASATALVDFRRLMTAALSVVSKAYLDPEVFGRDFASDYLASAAKREAAVTLRNIHSAYSSARSHFTDHFKAAQDAARKNRRPA